MLGAIAKCILTLLGAARLVRRPGLRAGGAGARCRLPGPGSLQPSLRVPGCGVVGAGSCLLSAITA